jgi:uncharacterized protein (TIGR03435 family)
MHGFLALIGCVAIPALALNIAAAGPAQSIVGTWQGTLSAGEGPRIMLQFSEAGQSGALQGSITFIDKSPDTFPLLSVNYRARELSVGMGEYTFRGKLSGDGKSIAGSWTQGNQSYPLTFALATPETLWTYSGPSTVPTMSAIADPSFEVAIIKPSLPDAKNYGYKWQTRLFQARDNTVADLIRFAYQVRQRQIDGGPSWINEIRFDVTGEPDAPGLPSLDQQRLMLRKLLAGRFDLRIHVTQREFPIYALAVDKSPPKIRASDSGANTHIAINLRGLEGGNTAAQFSHTTMTEFTDLLMNFIQDRQIVDETGLKGRFDFTLMISTSLLHESGSTGDADRAAAFLLGVQSLGFKLSPKKEPLEVIMIDRVEKPSAN